MSVSDLKKPEGAASLSDLLNEFLSSEKSGGVVLVVCAILSLILANSPWRSAYVGLWHAAFIGLSVEHWINDGLMAVFFFLIGLELKREFYVGELSDRRVASLPIAAAVGGMIVPASLYMLFNAGTATGSGAGIPMATDIAFALGVLSLLGSRVPVSLKIFLTALAVVDDLGAILVIAVFYTSTISLAYAGSAAGIFCLLAVLNYFGVRRFVLYLLGGSLMWYCMLHSGIHATIAGVLLAAVFPFGDGSDHSPARRMQHILHKPVAFIILPVFALANTCIPIESEWMEYFVHPHSLGIIAGLILGKPLGIMLFSFAAVGTGLSTLPGDVKWRQIGGVGFLGGIGFTMSIFITLLAFHDPQTIDQAKIAILCSSAFAGMIGYVWLRSIR